MALCAHTFVVGNLKLTDEGMSSILPALRQTYDDAVACIDTNYYGTKRVTEALLPLLQLSSSGARIVIVSSDNGQLKVRF